MRVRHSIYVKDKNVRVLSAFQTGALRRFYGKTNNGEQLSHLRNKYGLNEAIRVVLVSGGREHWEEPKNSDDASGIMNRFRASAIKAGYDYWGDLDMQS